MKFYKEHPFICKLIITTSLVTLVVIYLTYGYKISEWTSSFDSDSSDYKKISYSYNNDSDDTVIQTDAISNRTLYEAKFIELASGTHMVPRLVTTSGNCLYYVTMEGESSENSESYTIWCENFENDHTTEQILQLPTDNQITQITVDEEHNIYLFTKTRVNILEGEISRYYMTKYQKNGKAVLYKEITEYIVCDEQPIQYYREYKKDLTNSSFFNSSYFYSPYDVLGAGIGKNGIIYATNERGIVAFSNNGKKLFWIDDVNYNAVKGLASDREGNSYIVYSNYYYNNTVDYNYNMTATSVRGIGLFNQLSKTEYRLSDNSDYTLTYTGEAICSPGMNYDMLTKSDFGLYGIDFKKRTAHEILIWANAGIDRQEIDYVAELDDGRFLAISHCFDDGPVKAAIISPIKYTSENKPKIITLGVCGIDEYIEDAVIEYNKNQDDYMVQLVLADDVAQASQCDIFSIDGNSEMAEKYVTEGKIEDLTPYFEASTKVSTDDFLPQVVEAHTYDDLLIGIPSSVYLKITNKEAVGGTANWTLDDIPNIIALNNDELEGKLDAYTIAYTLAYYNCHDFVDLVEASYHTIGSNDSSGYYFLSNSDETISLEKIINYAKTFPTDVNTDTPPEGFMKYTNIFEFQPKYINDVSDISKLNDIDKYAGVLRDNGATYCISALSENKFESWQFLEYLLSASSTSPFKFGTEIEYNYIGDGIPTRKDLLEKETLQYSDTYDNEHTERFLRFVSESMYMKYNVSVLIMDEIDFFINNAIGGDWSSYNELYSIECGVKRSLEDYLNYFY